MAVTPTVGRSKISNVYAQVCRVIGGFKSLNFSILSSKTPFSNAVLLETAYFPNVEYLAAAVAHPSVILESCEHFQKNSFRNRTQIATANGIQTLSVPLKKGKNERQPIRDVRISNDVDWQRNHWQAIKTAYGNAPFWDFYAPIFEPLFAEKYAFLFDLNHTIFKTILKILKLETIITLSFSTTYERFFTEGYDYRGKISPKVSSDFGVRYAQVFEDRLGFVSNLSALDLLFCCGNQSLDILKKSLDQSRGDSKSPRDSVRDKITGF